MKKSANNYIGLEKINSPEALAVVWFENNQRKSYRYDELLNIINQRAAYYHTELGINKHDLVAILAPRGPEYLINMLVLWQIGAVYFPLSDDWTEKNALLNRLNKGRPKRLLTLSTTLARFRDELESWQEHIVQLDQIIFPDCTTEEVISLSPDDPAYVYSSSGTTDVPKLILLPHAGIADRIDDHIEQMNIVQGDGILGVLDFGFDASMAEMMLAMRSGNTLFIAPSEVRAQILQGLPEFCVKCPEISVAILMPSILSNVKAKNLPNLTKVVTMGEACLMAPMRQNGWFAQADIFNGYGPTETTFGATLTRIHKFDTVPSILRAMKGITLYLRTIPESGNSTEIVAQYQNNSLTIASMWQDYFQKDKCEPILIEIIISSNGIGTYIGLPEKVKEKFLDNGSDHGYGDQRVFISGDLADFDATHLIYVGRQDNQIKRYGALITLDEVESALCKTGNGVAAAAVLYKNNKLIAFLQPIDPNVITNRTARAEASTKLSHTIYQDSFFERKFRPNVCFWIKELPQTKRNKISRTLTDYHELDPKRLLLPTKKDQDDDAINNLTRIWSNLLEGDLVAIDSNELSYDLDASFTHLGGDSLMMSQMIQMVWESLGNGDTPAPNDFARAIIYNPTLNGIKRFLSLYNYQAIQLHYSKDNGLPVFSFLKLGSHCLLATTYKINLPEQKRSTANDAILSKTLMIVLKRQCRQAQPEGPYHFICDENDSKIAYELSAAFAELGEQVYLTFVATHYECVAIPGLMIEHCNDQDELSAIITNTLQLRIKQSITEKLAQLTQTFLKSAVPLPVNPCSTQKKLNQFLHESKINKTFWLIGPAGSGKTTLIQSSISLCASNCVLPLDVAGMTAHNLFEEALLRTLPRWQWPWLQVQHLTIIIDGYDRMARYDCPDIWQQAEKLGFTNISWIISCREVYWQIYSDIIMQYQNNTSWQIHKHAERQSEFAAIATQLGVPATHAAFQCYQKTSSATLDEQRFNWFMAWWQRDYHYYKPAISFDSYTQKAFTTLDILCKEYVNNGSLLITLQPSHWQLYLDKPSVQALPCFQSVLSILPLANLPVQLYQNLLKDYLQQQRAQTYQTLSEKLQDEMHSTLTEDFWGKFDNSANARYHILPLQVIPSSTPLFIFHPLTGETPISYRKLGEAFPQQTIYAMQMGPHDNQTTSLEKAQLYLHYIKTIQPKGPYVLMGWSFGVAVAFHVAYLLEQQDEIVDSVINIDSPPPQFIATIAPEERAKDMIIQLTKTVYNVPLDEQLFLSLLRPDMGTTTIFAKAIDHIKQLPDASRFENCLQALTKANLNLLVYHDFANWCNTEKPKLNAKLYVFEASIKRTSLNNTPFNDWKTYATTIIQALTGNHFELFNAVLFNSLAPLLNEYQAKTVLPLDERLALHCSRVLCHEFVNVIPAMADNELNGKAPFKLDDHLINAFLNNDQEQATQCFLLQGEPGSGKSLYASLLEQKCSELGSHFPIRVTLKPGGIDLVKSSLLNIGLTEHEYNELKSKLQYTDKKAARQLIIREIFGAPLLVIFDGYDEAFSHENLFLKENLSLWAAIAFISCRHYAVNPFKMNEQFGDDNGRLFTAFLQPFTMTEVENYLTLNAKSTGLKLDRAVLAQAPDTTILQNPLLLSLAIQFWDEIPTLDNRAALYRRFFKSLFERYQAQLRISEGIRPSVNLTEAFEKYCQRLAIDIFNNIENKSTTISASNEKIADNTDTTQVKKAKHFITNEDGGLSHITYWEFQLANAIIGVVLTQDMNDLNYAYAIILTAPTLCQNLSLLEMIRDLARMLPFPEFDRFRHKLLLTVYASRFTHVDVAKDRAKVEAATNAISILTVMRIPFSGLDLHGIRVPNAYLCNALFHRTNLQNANLDNTRIQGAVFDETDLRGAQLNGVDNPVKTLLNTKQPVTQMAHAANAGIFALVLEINIEICSINPAASHINRLRILMGHQHKILKLALSQNGQNLASFDTHQFLKVWNTTTGECIYSSHYPMATPFLHFTSGANNTLVVFGVILEKAFVNDEGIRFYDICNNTVTERNASVKLDYYDICSIAHHPNQPLIAVGRDREIYLWNIEIRKLLKSFTVKLSEVFLEFSPDGDLLLAYDKYNLQLWNTKNWILMYSSNTEDTDKIKEAIFSNDSKIIIASMESGIFKIFLTQDLRLLRIANTSGGNACFIFSRDNQCIITGGLSCVQAWNIKSLSNIIESSSLSYPIKSHSWHDKFFSVDNQYMLRVTCMNTFTEKKLSLTSDAEISYESLFTFSLGRKINVTSICTKSDLGFFAIGFSNGSVELWPLKHDSKILKMQVSSHEISRITFVPKHAAVTFHSIFGNAESLLPDDIDKTEILVMDSEGGLYRIKLRENKLTLVIDEAENAQPSEDAGFNNLVLAGRQTASSNSDSQHDFDIFDNSKLGNYLSYFKVDHRHNASFRNAVIKSDAIPKFDLGNYWFRAHKFLDVTRIAHNFAETKSSLGVLAQQIDIFRLVLSFLPFETWPVIACINQSSHAYVGSLIKIVRHLVQHALPIVKINIQHASIHILNDVLHFSFSDNFQIKHHLSWPRWYFQDLYALPRTLHPETILETNLDIVEGSILFNFSESSTRRLVYLLSTTYLLQQAINTLISSGIAEQLSLEPVSLNTLTHYQHMAEFLRVLRFLGAHDLIKYDESNHTVALSPTLGVGMKRYIQLTVSERASIRNKCAVTFMERSLRLEGAPAAVFSNLYQLGDGSRYLHNAAKYQLFDTIHNRTLEEIRNAAHKKLQDIEEICDYLHQFQFISRDEDEKYHLTELGEHLRSDHPETLQPTLAMIHRAWWNAVDEFHSGFTKNPKQYMNPFQLANLREFFNYLSIRPNAQAKFNRGLACLTKNTNKVIVTQLQTLPAFDLKNFQSIIDIPGGAGGLLTEIHKHYPDIHQLTLFDQAAVIEDVLSNRASKDFSWKFIKGDLFKPSPENAIPQDNDLYIIKGTLHDFDDETCLRILSHVRENIPAHSSLFLIERTLPNTDKPHINYYGDLMMMMLIGGRGRRPYDWLRLLSLTGFHWLNADNPLEAEDHTIMLCKPSNAEISRGLRLFDHKKPLRIQQFDQNGDYQPDNFLLLLQAINPKQDLYAMLPPVELNNFVNLDLATFEQNYMFLALHHNQNWCGMIIDRFSQQALYFDPCGNPLPEQLHNFMGLTVHTLQRKLCGPQNSGALLLALFVSALNKFELLETPTYTHAQTSQWLEYVHNSVRAETADAIEMLRNQQQRWANSFLEESTKEHGLTL